ncbi:phosphatase PAP2 family protein [Rouxiella sp. WC2420]|uniref:Phosphatase PAP2 family protein n=1 Tax=Rouxiella sp. WC2420 TaxID=3234145 RepID=A0AB39VRS5_9GAMM
MYWNSLTYFGDSMLLLPTGIIIAFFMAWKVTGRFTPLVWLFTFGISGFLVCISKLLFLGWGIGSTRYNFTGFSGHTTMSATIWPVLLWLLSGGLHKRLRQVTIAVGFLLPVLIGYSRVILGAHSPSEVITGLIIGLSASSIFLITQRHQIVKAFTFSQLAIMLIVPILLVSRGKQATTQNMIEQFAEHITGHPAWTREKLLSQLG